MTLQNYWTPNSMKRKERGEREKKERKKEKDPRSIPKL